jgi:hypothetical protein
MAEQPQQVSGRAGIGTLLRLALPTVPVLGSLPGIAKERGAFGGLAVAGPPRTPEREHVTAYAELCGFPVKDTLPLPYPHLLAFPLQMAIMGSPRFPVAALGMVHLENAISQHRPIAVGEELRATVGVAPAVPHPAGLAFRFTSEVYAGPELVWEETSVYLRRGPRNPDAAWTTDLVEVPPSGPVWQLRGDLGRRYGAVSGDINPIHLTSVTAKALGMPRHLAHGMWTLARSVAQLENRLPDAVRVEVAFRKPVFLPSAVAYGARPDGTGYAFSLHRRGSDTLHLLGRTSALT